MTHSINFSTTELETSDTELKGGKKRRWGESPKYYISCATVEESREKNGKKTKHNSFQQFSGETEFSNKVTIAEEAKEETSIGRTVKSHRFLAYCAQVES